MCEDELLKFELKWKQIYSEGIEKLFRNIEEVEMRIFDKNEYMKLYTNAHDICNSKSPIIQKKFYERLCEVVRVQCKIINEKIRKEKELEDFSKLWNIFENIILHWMLKIFSCFTRSNLKIRKNYNIDCDLKNIFKEEIFEKKKNVLIESFLNYLYDLRMGKDFDVSILKRFIDFSIRIENVQNCTNLYSSELEQIILDKTNQYYNSIVFNTYSNKNYNEYLTWGIYTVLREEEQLSLFIPTNTMSVILNDIKNIIFFNNSRDIIERDNSLKYILHVGDLKAISLTYTVFNQEQKSCNLILAIFKIVVREEFNSLIQRNNLIVNGDNPRDIIYNSNYMEEFFTFYDKFSKIINEAFCSNNYFNIGIREVLENIQSNNIKFNNSYLLPFYIDKLFKRGQCLETANIIIERIIQVFPTLPDKDIFIDTYRNLLSSRLLTDDFISINIEKELVSKLNASCGGVFTANIEVMINDYTNSIVTNQNFNSKKAFIKVLTRDCWPTFNMLDINVPLEIKEHMNEFTSFFISNNKNKNIQWCLYMSIVEIDYTLKKKKYRLIMNTIQASILINIFNTYKNEAISFSKLLELTGIIEEELLKALIPFININILSLSTNDIKSSDFIINGTFSSNDEEIKLYSNINNNEIIRKEKIEDDRSFAIEAAIVRFLKHNHRMSHSDLIQNVSITLDNFRVKIPLIKKKIDNLIEREIIKRDESDINYYIYTTN